MSGPSLRKRDAHHSIHEGAQFEAEELLSILIRLYRSKEKEKCIEVAFALIESFEARTLGHADSEEESFYKEKVEEKPNLHDTVVMLTRDHSLMRIIVQEIKDILQENEVIPPVIDRFKSLLIINRIHGQDEEKYLLS